MISAKDMEFQVKIGLFVLIGVILLTVITFSIGDFLFKPGYHIYVDIDFANGVQESAPVRLAGIEVGEVKKATVFKDDAGNTKVTLELWLFQEAQIENDAVVTINSLGLIGEKYVEILPGTLGAPLLKDGDLIKGSDTATFDELTRKGYSIAEKIEKLIDAMQTVIEHVQEGKGTVGKLLYEEGLYDEVTGFVTDLKEHTEAGKGNIGKFFYDETLYNEVDDFVKDLKSHPWKLMKRPK
ncbi:MAG: MlaD family protein [Candidatus Omnitrophota bacterium]